MATLQKFKLFAAQCGVALSPTCSPRASPVAQLCRQSQNTTLRMLFTRGRGMVGVRLVNSVEPELGCEKRKKSAEWTHSEGPVHVATANLGGLIAGLGLPRPVFMGLRFRSLMLWKAWRPTLETIAE
ncbi:hypothetical protein NL676_037880 [Syzygium grande]|nr:hypothetical protein NL676_037880 [Syzygium grande]